MVAAIPRPARQPRGAWLSARREVPKRLAAQERQRERDRIKYQKEMLRIIASIGR